MKKQVYDIFKNINEKKSHRHDNCVIIRKITNKQNKTTKTNIDGKTYFLKRWNGVNSVFEIASSKMYGDTGILTPPISIGKYQNFFDKFTYYYTVSQDATQLKNLEVVLANDIPQYQQIKNKYTFVRYKWQLLYDKALRDNFLEFMTEDCLNQLINVYLADELRTDFDRHFQNFFLYKSPHSDKFEGVIPIDLEAGLICCFTDNAWGNFYTYTHTPLCSNTPTAGTDDINHINRIRDIQEMLDDGVLSQDNITLLKDIISYNFPKEIQETAHEYYLKDKEYNILLPNIVKKLWDYNYNELGKDLGL